MQVIERSRKSSRKPIWRRALERFRAHGLARTLRDGRSALLYAAHYRLHDRRFEQLESSPTSRVVEARRLDLDQASRARSSEHLASPRRCVAWLIEAIPHELEALAFVDAGAGLGRAVLTAAEYPFREVVGYELSPTLAKGAEANIRGYSSSRVRAQSVTIRQGDALSESWPEGPAAFFLFNPFNREPSERFLARLERRRAQGAVDYLALLNFQYPELLDASGFEPVPLAPLARLRLSLLSPYPAQLLVTAAR